MQRALTGLPDVYGEMERIISDLVECYALPHTRMCMRWSHPTPEEYRAEVVAWLEDYARSFHRLPKESLPGRDELPAFARKLLDREVERIVAGRHPAVERSFEQIFG